MCVTLPDENVDTGWHRHTPRPDEPTGGLRFGFQLGAKWDIHHQWDIDRPHYHRHASAGFRDPDQLGEHVVRISLQAVVDTSLWSRARDEGTEESDLDVLVVVQDKDRALYRRIVEESLDIDLA